MAMVEINWLPTRTDLKVFGIGLAVFCAVVGVLCYRSDGEFGTAEMLLAAVAALSVVIGLLAPSWLRPVYLVFVVLAFPIGWVVSHVLLAVVFYGVFTPIGLVMRLLGRDPLERRFDPEAPSYWVPCERQRSSEDYFRQF